MSTRISITPTITPTTIVQNVAAGWFGLGNVLSESAKNASTASLSSSLTPAAGAWVNKQQHYPRKSQDMSQKSTESNQHTPIVNANNTSYQMSPLTATDANVSTNKSHKQGSISINNEKTIESASANTIITNKLVFLPKAYHVTKVWDISLTNCIVTEAVQTDTLESSTASVRSPIKLSLPIRDACSVLLSSQNRTSNTEQCAKYGIVMVDAVGRAFAVNPLSLGMSFQQQQQSSLNNIGQKQTIRCRFLMNHCNQIIRFNECWRDQHHHNSDIMRQQSSSSDSASTTNIHEGKGIYDMVNALHRADGSVAQTSGGGDIVLLQATSSKNQNAAGNSGNNNNSSRKRMSFTRKSSTQSVNSSRQRTESVASQLFFGNCTHIDHCLLLKLPSFSLFSPINFVNKSMSTSKTNKLSDPLMEKQRRSANNSAVASYNYSTSDGQNKNNSAINDLVAAYSSSSQNAGGPNSTSQRRPSISNLGTSSVMKRTGSVRFDSMALPIGSSGTPGGDVDKRNRSISYAVSPPAHSRGVSGATDDDFSDMQQYKGLLPWDKYAGCYFGQCAYGIGNAVEMHAGGLWLAMLPGTLTLPDNAAPNCSAYLHPAHSICIKAESMACSIYEAVLLHQTQLQRRIQQQQQYQQKRQSLSNVASTKQPSAVTNITNSRGPAASLVMDIWKTTSATLFAAAPAPNATAQATVNIPEDKDKIPNTQQIVSLNRGNQHHTIAAAMTAAASHPSTWLQMLQYAELKIKIVTDYKKFNCSMEEYLDLMKAMINSGDLNALCRLQLVEDAKATEHEDSAALKAVTDTATDNQWMSSNRLSLLEIISRLTRKLEPGQRNKLFPIRISTRNSHVDQRNNGHSISNSSSNQQATKQGLSPLTAYVYSLHSKQLTHSSRLLTLACDTINEELQSISIGRTANEKKNKKQKNGNNNDNNNDDDDDDPITGTRCLVLALELLYESLRHLHLSIFVESYAFCIRLEAMIAETLNSLLVNRNQNQQQQDVRGNLFGNDVDERNNSDNVHRKTNDSTDRQSRKPSSDNVWQLMATAMLGYGNDLALVRSDFMTPEKQQLSNSSTKLPLAESSVYHNKETVSNAERAGSLACYRWSGYELVEHYYGILGLQRLFVVPRLLLHQQRLLSQQKRSEISIAGNSTTAGNGSDVATGSTMNREVNIPPPLVFGLQTGNDAVNSIGKEGVGGYAFFEDQNFVDNSYYYNFSLSTELFVLMCNDMLRSERFNCCATAVVHAMTVPLITQIITRKLRHNIQYGPSQHIMNNSDNNINNDNSNSSNKQNSTESEPSNHANGLLSLQILLKLYTLSSPHGKSDATEQQHCTNRKHVGSRNIYQLQEACENEMIATPVYPLHNSHNSNNEDDLIIAGDFTDRKCKTTIPFQTLQCITSSSKSHTRINESQNELNSNNNRTEVKKSHVSALDNVLQLFELSGLLQAKDNHLETKASTSALISSGDATGAGSSILLKDNNIKSEDRSILTNIPTINMCNMSLTLMELFGNKRTNTSSSLNNSVVMRDENNQQNTISQKLLVRCMNVALVLGGCYIDFAILNCIVFKQYDIAAIMCVLHAAVIAQNERNMDDRSSVAATAASASAPISPYSPMNMGSSSSMHHQVLRQASNDSYNSNNGNNSNDNDVVFTNLPNSLHPHPLGITSEETTELILFYLSNNILQDISYYIALRCGEEEEDVTNKTTAKGIRSTTDVSSNNDDAQAAKQRLLPYATVFHSLKTKLKNQCSAYNSYELTDLSTLQLKQWVMKLAKIIQKSLSDIPQ